MKALPNSEKLRYLIAQNMTDIITFLDKNGKYGVYIGRDIHGIYRYLEIIESPTTLTTSGQRFHHFGPSYSSNNHAETLLPVIAALLMRQKSICECCVIIVHKSDACIIPSPKLISASLRRRINQFNALHCDEPK